MFKGETEMFWKTFQFQFYRSENFGRHRIQFVEPSVYFQMIIGLRSDTCNVSWKPLSSSFGYSKSKKSSLSSNLKGKGTPNRNLTCFVCYLKIIIKNVWKNNVSILKQIVWESQYDILFLESHHAVLEFLVKTIIWTFWTIA